MPVSTEPIFKKTTTVSRRAERGKITPGRAEFAGLIPDDESHCFQKNPFSDLCVNIWKNISLAKDRNLKYDIAGHRYRNFNRRYSNYCNLHYLRWYPLVEMVPATALIAEKTVFYVGSF